ncbi:MAG: RNA polymerase sigma factor [Tepidisphaerales bacterium]
MNPSLDPTIVESAQRGHPDAIHAVLAQLYPAVARMALALAGRNDVARGILSFVMRQGARRFDTWQDPDAPWRWFLHHTVLTARRSAKHTPSAAQEVLTHHFADGTDLESRRVVLPHDRAGSAANRPQGTAALPQQPSLRMAGDPAFVAFVRALRLLPEQQREAILLSHGEKLPERPLAITMDCSTSAAAAHLRSAEASLTTIFGPSLPDMLTRLHDAYAQLTPSDDIIAPAVRQWVEKALRPRRTRRLLRRLLCLALAAAAIWAAFHFLSR